MIVEYPFYTDAYYEKLEQLRKLLLGRTEEEPLSRSEVSERMKAGRIALFEGELIGFFVLIPERGPFGRSDRARLFLGVEGESRGCGVGRRLLELACRTARGKFSSLLAFTGDRHGVRLLADCGFRRVGRLEGGVLFEYLCQ